MQNKNQKGKGQTKNTSPERKWGLSRRLAEWQTLWKVGILNTNIKGQRFEAEELCTQLGSL